MVILAQGTLIVALIFLLFLGGICLLALLSFILSFTNAKRHWATLVAAIPAFVLEFALTVTHGVPRPGDMLVAYVVSWLNLLFGSLSLFRWIRNQAV